MKVNLENILSSSGITEFGIISPTEVEFSQEVRKMCEKNTCRSYNISWACPPAIGTVEECKNRCRQYSHMLVFNKKYDLEDSFDYEGMQEGMHDFKKVSHKVEEALKPYIGNYFVLSNEECDNCEKCTYPEKPCRFPDKAYGSIEGYGIFVSKLAEQVSIKYHNGPNTVTYFGAVLFNESPEPHI